MDATGFDSTVRLEIYRHFIDRGRPPVPGEVAEALGTGQAEVEDSFQRLHDSHVIVLAPGTPYVWMANPLSALPTPFSVSTGQRSWFANCIWDALGTIAMLDGSGSVETRCPDCLDPIEVAVDNGRLQPTEAVVHFAVPARHWWDDIGFN